MILKCDNCGSESIQLASNKNRACFICFTAAPMREIEESQASEVSKSWNQIGKMNDKEVKKLCQDAAEEVLND